MTRLWIVTGSLRFVALLFTAWTALWIYIVNTVPDQAPYCPPAGVEDPWTPSQKP